MKELSQDDLLRVDKVKCSDLQSSHLEVAYGGQ
jgi:hypothetical protein